jgi:hypothetical protein
MWVGAGLLSMACAGAGCGGASADLTRAREAYDHGDLYRTLALLRIVGESEASLSLEARAQHAYLRGMTDYRIAATLSDDRAEERAIFRGCARRWLERARSFARNPMPNGLSPEQIELVARTSSELADVAESDCDRSIER